MSDPGIRVFWPERVQIRCTQCGRQEEINSRGIGLDHPHDADGVFAGVCPECTQQSREVASLRTETGVPHGRTS